MIKKTIFSSLVVLVHAIVSKTFVLVVNVFLARNSTPIEYGLFVLIRSIINFIDTIFSASVMPVMTKKAGSGGVSNYVAVRFLIITTMILIGLLLQTLIVFVFSISTFIEPQIETYASIAGYLVLLMLLNGLFTSVLMGQQGYSLLLKSSAVSFLSCIFFISVVIHNHGITGALISMAVFQGMEIVIKGYMLLKAFNVTSDILVKMKSYFLHDLKLAFKNILPLVAASLVNSVVFLFARLNLSGDTDGLSQLAYFDVAFQFFIVSMLVLNSITNIYLTKMSKATDYSALTQLLVQNVGVVTIAALTGTLIIYMGADYLIMVFGENYSSTELKVMSFCIVPYGFAIVFNRFFIVLDERNKLTVVSILSGLVMVCFLVFSDKTALNLIHGFTLYYLVSTFIYFYFIWKRRDHKTLKKFS